MIRGDPNIASVERVAAALGDLCDQLVLVGGCAASLLIDSPVAPPPRVTTDVDLIATVTALRDYHALERLIAARGFKRDLSPDAPICRWCLGVVAVDLMPTDARVLGFSNRWYAEAAATALRIHLPGGAAINLASAPAFLGTKFEAFRARGQSDLLGSHDFEDIVAILEGRAAIVEEIADASQPLRAFIAQEFGRVIRMKGFNNILPGLVAHDALHESRVQVVRQRIGLIADMRPNRPKRAPELE